MVRPVGLEGELKRALLPLHCGGQHAILIPFHKAVHGKVMKLGGTPIGAVGEIKDVYKRQIPLSAPGISTGITMVFVPSVSTFIISRMLGGGGTLLAGDLIELQFLGNSYNYNLGSAMSLVLMVIVLLCMSFTSGFDDQDMEGVL